MSISNINLQKYNVAEIFTGGKKSPIADIGHNTTKKAFVEHLINWIHDKFFVKKTYSKARDQVYMLNTLIETLKNRIEDEAGKKVLMNKKLTEIQKKLEKHEIIREIKDLLDIFKQKSNLGPANRGTSKTKDNREKTYKTIKNLKKQVESSEKNITLYKTGIEVSRIIKTFVSEV
ncbi:MAG: hypothetical protein ABIH00_11435 [Armatimonadota bacterium]